jgi:hypothetical protein
MARPATKPPVKVLPHQAASTGLFFSEGKREEYAPHLEHFKSLMTFEEIEAQFPSILPFLP